MKNKIKTGDHILPFAIESVLFIAYGIFSMYSLYKILPEDASIFFIIIMLIGGFVFAFGPFFLFISMADDGGDSHVYRNTVLISLYCIPILIYGSYIFKLHEVEKHSYRIRDEKTIIYTLTSDISVVDNGDPDSSWNVSFKDMEDNTLDTKTEYSVGKFDIIPLVVNIRCDSHDIEDRDNPAANLDAKTVQRLVFFSFADDVGKRSENAGDLVVFDEYDNEINIHINVGAERHDSVWKILTAKLADDNEVTQLNAYGEKCPNLDHYTAGFDTETDVGDGMYYIEGGRRYSYLTLINDSLVLIEYFLGDNSDIVCAGLINGGTLTKTEADGLFDRILAYAKEKYGYSDDDDFTNHSYWTHERDDLVTFINEEPEEDGSYSVHFYALDPKFINDTQSNQAAGKSIDGNEQEQFTDGTWGELKEANGGELPYETLSDEQMEQINYPELDPNKVYWTPNGKSYHSVDWCYTLSRSTDIRCGTLDEAIAEGKDDPCSKCVGN